MPITVNGEMLPEAFIEIERERLASHPDFRQIADARERETRLGKAAEETAINRMLMAQAAARDPRPVPEQEIQRECDSFRARNGEHVAFEAHVLRGQCEALLRLRRTVEEIRSQAAAPSEESIRATYERYKDTFEQDEQVHAAQIVKHTAEGLQEEAARLGSAPRRAGQAWQAIIDGNVIGENEGPSKSFRLGLVSGLADKLSKLLVGYRILRNIKRRQGYFSHWAFAVRRERFGRSAAHSKRASFQKNHRF